jgi:hypothetical protein
MKATAGIELLSVQKLYIGNEKADREDLLLKTNQGDITCRFHFTEKAKCGVIWVGGAGGGLDGPAGGLYPRVSRALIKDKIASLRLHYRHPNILHDCVLDTVLGVLYLKDLGINRVALVGHSFGGAVVITAGALSNSVCAVAALSSQTYGTENVQDLSPRSLLLIHGDADEVLPFKCSQQIYERAEEPKQLIRYRKCRHGLDECRDRLDADLHSWLLKVFESSAVIL